MTPKLAERGERAKVRPEVTVNKPGEQRGQLTSREQRGQSAAGRSYHLTRNILPGPARAERGWGRGPGDKERERRRKRRKGPKLTSSKSKYFGDDNVFFFVF